MNAQTNTGPLTGGCQCGAVRFEAVGTPNWVAHCHCSLCRNQTSAAFATWVSVASDDFVWSAGGPKIFTDSPDRHRGFCAECGTQLVGLSPKWPEETHILVGALDDPNRVTPFLHAYFADALDWIDTGADGLPQYATLKREGPPLNPPPAKPAP